MLLDPAALPDTPSTTRAERTAALFDAAHATEDQDERRRLLDEVILLHLRVAQSIAGRYRNRGVDLDDLHQVAYTALTRATQRFDPTHGSDFMAFATPTIRGDLRKYFRDHGWVVRPTRSLQELQARALVTRDELAVELERPPRTAEVAERLGEDESQVGEALGLTAAGCFTPSSLDVPVVLGDDESESLGATLGVSDEAIAGAEARAVLFRALRRLGERDRRLVAMRFVDGLTQREIATEFGVTQMQISRLLQRLYGDLRRDIGELEPDHRLSA